MDLESAHCCKDMWPDASLLHAACISTSSCFNLHPQGKAAIDVICNPLGKSGGALIQQFMIIGFGSLAASTPYLGAVLLAIVLVWIQAAASLNKQFTALQVETGNTMEGIKDN